VLAACRPTEARSLGKAVPSEGLDDRLASAPIRQRRRPRCAAYRRTRGNAQAQRDRRGRRCEARVMRSSASLANRIERREALARLAATRPPERVRQDPLPQKPLIADPYFVQNYTREREILIRTFLHRRTMHSAVRRDPGSSSFRSRRSRTAQGAG